MDAGQPRPNTRCAGSRPETAVGDKNRSTIRFRQRPEAPGLDPRPPPRASGCPASGRESRTHGGPPGRSGRAVVSSDVDGGYFVRTTISAYGLLGATPPESAVTFAKPLAGTPNRAYAVDPPRE